MTGLQALLTLGIVTIAVAVLLLLHLRQRLSSTRRMIEHTTTAETFQGTGQIPMEELAIGLPSDYVVVSVDGETVVSLPSAEPLLAFVAGGALIAGASVIQNVVWLLTSSGDRWSALVAIAIGLLFVVGCGYISWPAVVRKRLRVERGRLSTEWSMAAGPAFWKQGGGVTRLIVRQGRWKRSWGSRRIHNGSTDQVVIDDGARRYVADTILNLPAYGSFRWFNNWKVAGSSPSLKSDPTKPWRAMSPVVLALAGLLANALGVPVFFEIDIARPPLITIGDD